MPVLPCLASSLPQAFLSCLTSPLHPCFLLLPDPSPTLALLSCLPSPLPQAKAGITSDIADKLTACSNELSKGRKKRAISPTGARRRARACQRPTRHALPSAPEPAFMPALPKCQPPLLFACCARHCGVCLLRR